MLQMAFVSACTAVMAVIGFYLGFTIHGPAGASLVPALAGMAGGFGIGMASLDVLRRWQIAAQSGVHGNEDAA